MPTAIRPLTIKVGTPANLLHRVDLLRTVLAEMQSINLNNDGLQWHTKIRWENHLSNVLTYFEKLIPGNTLPNTEGE